MFSKSSLLLLLCSLCGVFFLFISSGKKTVSTELSIHCGDTLVIVSPSLNKKGIPVLTATLSNNNKTLGTNSWCLNYPMYKMEQGDVNDDGLDDILVGITNTTRFDPVKRKRLHIFKLYEGYIRPLWLGSRVSQPLEDFHFIKKANTKIIRTIEQEKNGTFLIAEYKWKGFGLQFIQYNKRNITIKEAKQLLIK